MNEIYTTFMGLHFGVSILLVFAWYCYLFGYRAWAFVTDEENSRKFWPEFCQERYGGLGLGVFIFPPILLLACFVWPALDLAVFVTVALFLTRTSFRFKKRLDKLEKN